ncbi:MAG TPA: CPBP family intramembrane glutamic endopeptidase [Anaerolineae bacterium]|nr:CPBP family intramembrane glutamic endopeptidase [Anaerolineae bacterium]
MSSSITPDKDKYLGWKTLGAFVAAFVAGWIAGIVVGLTTRQISLLLHLSEPIGHTLSSVSVTAARLILWIPVTHIVLKRRLRDLTFRFHPGWWADLLAGIGITALAMWIVFIASERVGWLVVDGWMWQTLSLGSFLGTLWVTLLINVLVALGEEVIFRAYLLSGLKEAWGRWIGLAIMMVVFGIVHLPAYMGQGMQAWVLVLAIMLATVIGVMLGLVYLRTGSLWMPVGIHFAWNFVESDLLNLTGDATNSNLIGVVTRLQGPLSPTGAAYGNAIVLDLLAFVILSVGVWLWLARRRPVEKMRPL